MCASKVIKGHFDFMWTLSILLFNRFVIYIYIYIYINWDFKEILLRFSVLVN